MRHSEGNCYGMEVNSHVATPDTLAAKDALRIVQNDDSKGTSYRDIRATSAVARTRIG
jgi:hypothetical protein